eukprot:14452549-Ditylum_brightwellii.AAC.1
MWKKISNANKNKYESNVSSISIPESWPDADTTITADCELKDPKKAETWRTINLPLEILHYLTIHNRHRFRQAQGTLFTIPLSQYFNWAANSPVSEAVLSGTFTNDKLSKLQQLFLNHCKVKSFESVVVGKLTHTKWKGKVAKWCKATTTSPSGRHLEHFKVLTHRFSEDLNTEEGKEMQQKQTDLIDTHLGLINYS